MFITVVVIVVSLTVMGPTLPTVVRRARYPEDADRADEVALARTHLTRRALAVLSGLAVRHSVTQDTAGRVAQQIREQTDVPGDTEAADRLRRLELALLGVKRDALGELRDTGRIDDAVLRQVQHILDVEELRLSRTADSHDDRSSSEHRSRQSPHDGPASGRPLRRPVRKQRLDPRPLRISRRHARTDDRLIQTKPHSTMRTD
ncbi:hypothetical protein ACWGKK_33735 [Streptomyces chartreusis]